MSKSTQVSPKHLSVSSKTWWKQMVDVYNLKPHHLHLLKLAAEALDMAEEARKTLAHEGLTIHDRFGVARRHPATAVLQENRIAFARLLREIGVDEDEDEPRDLTEPAEYQS